MNDGSERSMEDLDKINVKMPRRPAETIRTGEIVEYPKRQHKSDVRAVVRRSSAYHSRLPRGMKRVGARSQKKWKAMHTSGAAKNFVESGVELPKSMFVLSNVPHHQSR